MALIECKYCGKPVSDKAKQCPNCGGNLLPEEQTLFKCDECGYEIPLGASECPNCGCPIAEKHESAEPQKVEIAKVSMAVDKAAIKKYVGFAVAAVILILLTIAGISLSKKNQAQKALENYSENFDVCISSMYVGAVNAETAGGQIHDVWFNTIYEEKDSETDKFTRTKMGLGDFYDDFNDSLANLFNDATFQIKISSIESNQTLVAELMKDLKNPPSEYDDAYGALKDLYDAYCSLTECAVNPSGSLQSYTSSFNSADSDFVKYFKAVKVYQ